MAFHDYIVRTLVTVGCLFFGYSCLANIKKFTIELLKRVISQEYVYKVGFLSIELEDLVDVCSHLLVESAVFSGGLVIIEPLTRKWGLGMSLKS